MTLLEKTLQDLRKFSPMEEYLRDHADIVDESGADCQELVKKTRDDSGEVTDELFFEQMSNRGEWIVVMQHMRFFQGNYHKHDFVEMFYIFEGECINTCDGNQYNLQKGDFCFWRRNCTHRIEVTSEPSEFLAVNILMHPRSIDTAFRIFMMQDNLISRYFFNFFYGTETDSMIIFKTGQDRDFSDQICRVYWEYKNAESYYQIMTSTLLSEGFVHLIRDHSRHVYTNMSEKHTDNFLEAMKYIEENYTTVTLEEVCSRFHYSISYFSKTIKKLSGKTFSEIITNQRMKLAEDLLSSTMLSITDIALKCGYSDSAYFSSVFSKSHGISPREYRKKKSE